MTGNGVDAVRLRTAREHAGLSLRDAAKAIGVTHSYISQLENEFKDPGVVKVLVALANLYGVSMDYLVGLESNVKRTSPDEGLPLEYRIALQVQRDVYGRLSDPETRAALFRHMAESGGDWPGFLARVEADILRELQQVAVEVSGTVEHG